MGVHDLNCELRICDAFGFNRPGVPHECWQDIVCTSHGVRAMEDVRTHHRASQRRRRCAHLGLRRLVSRDGLRAIDVARVFARHRGVPERQSGQAVSHGHEGPASPLDAVGCPEPSGLAHLPRTGDAAHSTRQGTLCQRTAGYRPGCHGLCTGRHDHRPVLESVRMGAVSFDQGGGEDAYAAGLAGLHSCVHSHQRWQDGRCHCAGFT